MRIKIIRIAIVCLFVIIFVGLVRNQIIQGAFYYNLSKNNRIRVVPDEGRRGRILDRNGVIIAGSRVSFDVTIIPQETKDRAQLFDYIATVLEKEPEELEKIFQKKMLAPFAPVIIAKDIDRGKAFILEENKFRFPGLLIQSYARRHYPFKTINAHVLGYVGKVNRSRITRLKDYGYMVPSVIGYSGAEEYYDTYLKGEDGGLQIEVDSRGQQVRILGIKQSSRGQDITLTLDNRIQQIAADLLKERRGAIIVMNAESGEILGMVSAPSFDPNAFVDEDTQKTVASFFSDSAAPLLNRAISGQYPPGSTFKIPVSVCALENKKIVPQTTFSCPGYYKLGRRRFRCSHTHGIQNLTEAIAHSCNVYFFNVGLLIGPDLLSNYAHRFGLGGLTHIDLPYEAKGMIPSRAQKRAYRKAGWYDGDTLNFSIGQGDVLVTPLQLLNMMAIVANDGRRVHPHVIRSIGEEGAASYRAEGRIAVDEKTFEIVKGGLRAAVGDYSGTAHILDLEDIEVSGKTGTAQTSGGRLSHAWFVGYCPKAKTKIAFVVFLEHGGSSYYACRVARHLLLRIHKRTDILQ